MNKPKTIQTHAENNGNHPYLTHNTVDEENIVIKIIRYPDDIVLNSITRRHSAMAADIIKELTDLVSTAHYRSDFFCTIMYNQRCEIIGYANFIRSYSESSKWFYSDLWIAPEYRRKGCAKLIINTALHHLSELDAKTLLCTVEPHNEASLKLHMSLNFEQIETQPFENFEVDGLIMFKTDIPLNFNIVPIADDFNHLVFICDLLTQPANVSTLHLKKIPEKEYHKFYKEMKKALINDTPDNEQSYIIRKGVVPIAWLKLNVPNNDSLWISMLVVHEKYRNIGVGMFALKFVEETAISAKCSHIYAHITSDNLIAQALYKSAGYIIVNEEKYSDEDNTESVRYTLRKKRRC